MNRYFIQRLWLPLVEGSRTEYALYLEDTREFVSMQDFAPGIGDDPASCTVVTRDLAFFGAEDSLDNPS